MKVVKMKVVKMNNDDKDVVLDLSFDLTPSWARNAPDATMDRFKGRQFDDSSSDGSFRRDTSRRDGSRSRPVGRDSADQNRGGADRRPRRDTDRKSPGPRPDMSRPESRGAVVDFSTSRPANDSRPPRREDNRPHFERPFRQEFQQPVLPLEIRVLPEQKALGAIIRRVQTSHRAFPLRDIASLFLDNPNSCLIRIEPLKDQQVPLFQCKVCGFPALTEEEVRTHLTNHHIHDFFEIEEVDCEPPSGVFNSVARCSLSGELLGPPNHHSFASKVQEVLRTKYPAMSEETYRARIEVVREPEVIEQWRQQCTKKKVYRRKGVVTETVPVNPPVEGVDVPVEPLPKAPPLSREVAELVFTREIVPAHLASVKHLVCTAAIAVNTSSRLLGAMLRDTLNRERRFPASLFFALRGAFRHRKLNLFRVNDVKGPDFVMLKIPSALDPAHTVQALHDVLMYVNEHLACTKMELITNLSGTDEAKKKEILIQLAWLLEKGHLIEFYNDVLSAPTEYPAFKYLPGEKQYQGSGGHRPPAPKEVAIVAPPPVIPAETALVEEPLAEGVVSAEGVAAEPLPAEEPATCQDETPTIEALTEVPTVEEEQPADPAQ
jgi:hypothetical protein